MEKITITKLDLQAIQTQLKSYIQQHWQLFLAEGIAFMVLGIAAILIPNLFSVAIIIFLGWILLFTGIMQVVRAVRFSNMPGFGLWLITGILQVVVGISFLGQPIAGIFTVTVLLTLFFAFEGSAKIYMGLLMRPLAHWGFMVFSGATAWLFSIVIWIGWPSNAEWIIGLLLGINLLILGWSMVKITLHHKESQ